MSGEPLLPVPPPEPNSSWNPNPARCPECREIIDAHPASRKDGRWEGRCPQHQMVVAVYYDRRDGDE